MPGYLPRVVVKFKNGEIDPEDFTAADRFLEVLTKKTIWTQVAASFPGIQIQKRLTAFTQEELFIRTKTHEPSSKYAQYAEDILTYFVVICPPPLDPKIVAAAFAASPWDALVERAYVEPLPSKRLPGLFNLLSPLLDPVGLRPDLGFLRAAPEGIDAKFAWTVPGGDGDGSGVQFVDVEMDWDIGHPDLPLIPSPPSPLYGTAYSPPDAVGLPPIDHGTGVLGIVVARRNLNIALNRIRHAPMSIGITPKLTSALVASYWTASNPYDYYNAINQALGSANPGDVVLLEIQLTGDNLPVEYDYGVFESIKYWTNFGRVVVEAAGNGGWNLDTLGYSQLIRGTGYDSRAIMVSAASSGSPSTGSSHTPLTVPTTGQRLHNYGSRIDCYAWGQNIYTITSRRNATMVGNLDGTMSYSGTSGAAAIVAGAALSIQGMANVKPGGGPLQPLDMRKVLSDPTRAVSADPGTGNTLSGGSTYDPSDHLKWNADNIGVMPNLKAIAQKLGFVDGPPAPPINLDIR